MALARCYEVISIAAGQYQVGTTRPLGRGAILHRHGNTASGFLGCDGLGIHIILAGISAIDGKSDVILEVCARYPNRLGHGVAHIHLSEIQGIDIGFNNRVSPCKQASEHHRQ